MAILSETNQAMVSVVSICNQALTWLGQDPITSLNENNPSAEWCDNNYPFLRDAVLEERMWTFATVRDQSTVADLDEWGQMYVHPVPVNWISIFRVYRNVNSANPANWIESPGWRLEEPGVMAMDSTVYLWGVAQVTDTGKFTPMFVQALAARMAADAAIPLTEDPQIQRDMWALYRDKLAAAAARDGQQGGNDVITNKELTNVRYSSGLGRL